MLTFFKSLFKGGSNRTSDKERQTFELFKYDGMRAQRIGRRDYAIKCFNKALEIEQDFETMSYLSQLYLEMGEPAEAKHWLEIMQTQEPGLASPLLALAHIEFLQGNIESMAMLAQRAVELDSRNDQAYFLWGKALGHDKNYAEAVKKLSKAIALKPDFEEAHLLRARFLLDSGISEEALDHINEVLKRSPEDESALLLYAHHAKLNGREAEAEATYQALVELNPFNVQAYHEWGQLLATQHRYQEAMDRLSDALELLPQSVELYELRGKLRQIMGDHDGAEQDKQEAERITEEISPDVPQSSIPHAGNTFLGIS